MVNTFSQRLKQARKSTGMSQKELAEKIGGYQTKYQNWEAGKNEPDMDTIKKLASALGVSLDWLLGKDEASKAYPTEFDKEIFLLREDARKYGSEGIKRLRMMIPLIFEKKTKK